MARSNNPVRQGLGARNLNTRGVVSRFNRNAAGADFWNSATTRRGLANARRRVSNGGNGG